MPRQPFTLNAQFLSGGYHAQQRNRDVTELTQPSINVRYTKDGGARTRDGYADTGWDLGLSTNPANGYHVERYNITFFCAGTSVKYVDHNVDDTVVDTGITLSGVGKDTWMEEYNGDLYLMNTTDGLQRIVIMRLNGSVTASDPTIIADKDGVARLSVFSKTSGNLRINGTDEAYNAVTVSTGTITLTGTASQGYDDNAIAIVVHDVSSGLPKGNKIVFWKESMNVIGVGTDETDTTKSDVPPTTMYFSNFATSTSSENIIDFSSGSSGYEMVGKTGEITNAIATRDYMYLFKNDETYYIPVTGVNIATGARPTQIFSAKYGCVNVNCSAVMGDFVVWLSPQKRIIKSNIRIEDGTSSLYPDEQFDAPLREILDLLDDDQSDAIVYYQTKRKELHVQCNVQGQTVEFVYDNDKGVWCPPDTNKNFGSFFEIKGQPYATSDNSDTIYILDEGYDDAESDIECCIASGIFEYEDGRTWVDWGAISVSGSGTVDTEIEYTPYTEQGDGTMKTIAISQELFGAGSPIGAVGIGSGIIGGGDQIINEAEFDTRIGIYPAKARQMQHKFYTFGRGSKMTIKSWLQSSKAFTRPLLTTI